MRDEEEKSRWGMEGKEVERKRRIVKKRKEKREGVKRRGVN